MKYAGLSNNGYYIQADNRFSGDPYDAEWFDNVGDAWGKCLAKGCPPKAKDQDGKLYYPDAEKLKELDSLLASDFRG